MQKKNWLCIFIDIYFIDLCMLDRSCFPCSNWCQIMLAGEMKDPFKNMMQGLSEEQL